MKKFIAQCYALASTSMCSYVHAHQQACMYCPHTKASFFIFIFWKILCIEIYSFYSLPLILGLIPWCWKFTILTLVNFYYAKYKKRCWIIKFIIYLCVSMHKPTEREKDRQTEIESHLSEVILWISLVLKDRCLTLRSFSPFSIMFGTSGSYKIRVEKIRNRFFLWASPSVCHTYPVLWTNLQ